MAKRSSSTTITPYIPDRTEYADGADGTWTDNDVGKAVKLDGENVTLCADGDEIYGFLQSRSVGTVDGNPIFGVNCDVNREQLVADVAGTLAVGNIVVASTQTAVGTAIAHANGTPVKVLADPSAAIDRWRVMSVLGTGANRQVLIRKV